MRRTLLALILAAPVLLGQTQRQYHYSTPAAPLTAPSSSAPEHIAMAYIASTAGLPPEGLGSVYVAKEYTTSHNGVTHLVYRQRFQGIDVYNGAWSANIGPDGIVLSAGGKLYPEPGIINFADQLPAATAVRFAVREVNAKVAGEQVQRKGSG